MTAAPAPTRARVSAYLAADAVRGTCFAIWAGMTTTGCALAMRFDAVCQAEVRRLGKKTASLSEDERLSVEELTAQVLQGIAARASRALDQNRDPELAQIVATLFRLAAEEPERTQSGFDLLRTPLSIPAR